MTGLTRRYTLSWSVRRCAGGCQECPAMQRSGHVVVIIMVVLILVLALAMVWTRPAAAFEAEAGRLLAERWCSACHSIEPSSGVDQAPTFEAIARDPSKKSDWVRAWLMTPHPAMPDMTLSRAEVEAIIAYLQSLGDA
jgi:mono/diheme cytochrome c family protein